MYMYIWYVFGMWVDLDLSHQSSSHTEPANLLRAPGWAKSTESWWTSVAENVAILGTENDINVPQKMDGL